MTDQIVQQCVELGIKHVWMHCMMGTKPGLVVRHDQRLAGRGAPVPGANGIAVIPGSCPNQFLNPDGGHKMMRWLWGALGFMKVSRGAGPHAAH